MAIGRYLAHRKTSDGSYEDVYLKSESGLIYRPNGRTVEQDLAAYLPVQLTSAEKFSILATSSGSVVFGITEKYGLI